MNFFKTILAEAKKEQQNSKQSLSSWFSLIVWPFLLFYVTYMSYKSFDISALNRFGISSQNSLLIFLLTGTLAYNYFWVMVQGAMRIVWERQNGTLETLFITPANRYALLLGRSLGGFVYSSWLFIVVSIILFVISGTVTLETIIKLIAVFIVLLISSVIWGAFINALFLINRNTWIFFKIFDSPMIFFSGIKFPTSALPFVGQAIAYVFPCTYCILLLRNIFLDDQVNLHSLLLLTVVCCILVIFALSIMAFAEKHNSKTGGFTLY